MIRKFVCPEIVFGNGAIETVANYAKNLALQNVLLVTDPGIVAAGWVEQVIDQLQVADIGFVVFEDVSPNPRMEEVMLGASTYIENECDGIIALGGGSPMDCAKGIGIVCSNGSHIRDFEGVDKVGIPMPPLICVPTTSGSSADVSQFAIITDTERKVKMAIISKAVVPDVAIIDPITLTTMDSYLSACTGIDALVHGIESYVSNAHSCITDPNALRAISRVSQNLEKAIQDPKNLEYRHEMMLGSMEAGLAFSNASLGMVHANAHSLGGLLDLAHGECNALLLDHVVRFNFDSVPNRYRDITRVVTQKEPSQIDGKCCDELTSFIVRLKESVGIFKGLAARGVETSHIRNLATFAYQDACIYTNPKKPAVEEIESVFRAAM